MEQGQLIENDPIQKRYIELWNRERKTDLYVHKEPVDIEDFLGFCRFLRWLQERTNYAGTLP